jgi:hypothetical protein
MVFDWINQKLKRPQAEELHFLASDDGIAEFQAGLPLSQPGAVLTQVCDALDSALGAGLDHPTFRRALRMLDKGAQAQLGELTHMLFRDARGDQVSEGSWVALNMYLNRMSAFYRNAIEQMPTTAKWEDEDREYALLMTGRAMRLMVARKKLLHFAYRTVEPDLWGHMSRVYTRSKTFGVQRTETEAYSGTGEKASVHSEYMVGLLFETAPLGGLLPTQMECLDLLLRRHAAQTAASDKPSPERPFFIDVSKNQPPQRWLEGLGARANLLFFGPGKAYTMLETLRVAAETATEVPDWAVPSNCDVRGYRGLLESLRNHWSTAPPQRRHRRNTGAAQVLVVHGFGQVRRMVAVTERAHSGEAFGGFDTDRLLDNKYFDKIRFGSVNPDQTGRGKKEKAPVGPKLTPREILEKLETRGDKDMMQNWVVLDTSDSGVGVLVPGRAPWAKLGVIVGYRLAEALQWEVSIIRRLGRNAENKLTVGLEKLSGQARSGRAMALKGAAREAWEKVPFDGDALEVIVVEGETRQLVLPPGRYGESDFFVVSGNETRFAAQVNGVFPPGADYQVVSYSPAGGYAG